MKTPLERQYKNLMTLIEATRNGRKFTRSEREFLEPSWLESAQILIWLKQHRAEIESVLKKGDR